jgi:hypothetical protein
MDRSKRNVIEELSSTLLTKKDLIDSINKNFPDDEIGTHGSIAQVLTVRMTNGTRSQSIIFGKLLKL